MFLSKKDLIREVSKATGYTAEDVKFVFKVLQEILYKHVANLEEVKLIDGLTIVGTRREAYTARNPQTGGTVEVPETTVVKAKIGEAFKRAVN